MTKYNYCEGDSWLVVLQVKPFILTAQTNGDPLKVETAVVYYRAIVVTIEHRFEEIFIALIQTFPRRVFSLFTVTLSESAV